MWRHPPPSRFAASRSRFISTRVETSLMSSPLRAVTAVHLHACGDIQTCKLCGGTQFGSSPRVWRHPDIPTGLIRPARFISTRVETSAVPSYRWLQFAVHLHACGDIRNAIRFIFKFKGSSPRVWRHLAVLMSAIVFLRFISTRVETSRRPCKCCPLLQVHLHACGDISVSIISLGS